MAVGLTVPDAGSGRYVERRRGHELHIGLGHDDAVKFEGAFGFAGPGCVQSAASRRRRSSHSRAIPFAMSSLRASAFPWMDARCMLITAVAPMANSVRAIRTSTAV